MNGLPTLACITMARNEALMLPRWIEHYARQTGGPQNLYVVDNGSTDGSVDDVPCSVIRIPQQTKNKFERSRMSIVSSLAAALLETYDAVAFTDADEFLVAEPTSFPTLRHLLDARRGRPVLAAQGLNVLHHPRLEPPLDPSRPVLEQRTLAQFVPAMCKPAIKTVKVRWEMASHGIAAPYEVDRELFMFHLKFADVDLLRRRQEPLHREGRGLRSNWSRSAEDVVQVVEGLTADIEDVRDAPEWRPRPKALARVPRDMGNGITRSGKGQVAAMLKNKVVRIPERFVGSL